MNHKVSVIIITYNRPIEVLLRAIKSVLCQTFTDYELKVVNDNPENSDNARQIVDEIQKLHDDRVEYISYDKNHGSNYARNYGLFHSSGEYVAFLDDDDEWLPNKLEAQIDVIERDSRIGLVSCGFLISDGNKIVGEKTTLPSYDKTIDGLIVYNYIAGTSFPLLRRAIVEKVGAFDEEMKSCQEYELWLRMRRECEFATIEKPLGIYYQSKDSVYQKNTDKYYAGDRRLLDKNLDLLMSHKKAYNMHLNGMALYFLSNREFRRYLQYKVEALKVRPFAFANLIFVERVFRKIKRKVLR